jgi:hypothetical protein
MLSTGHITRHIRSLERVEAPGAAQSGARAGARAVEQAALRPLVEARALSGSASAAPGGAVGARQAVCEVSP